MRPRSRRELERRLLAAGFEAEEVADVLERLERVGLIDDEAFARQVAEHAFGARRAGRRAVAGALLGQGRRTRPWPGHDASSPGDEEDRALELARARRPVWLGSSPPRRSRRLTSLLVRRGYAPEIARRAARRALDVRSTEPD